MGLFGQNHMTAYEQMAIDEMKVKTRRDIRALREQLKHVDELVVLDTGRTLEEAFVTDLVNDALFCRKLATDEELRATQWGMLNYLTDQRRPIKDYQAAEISDEEFPILPEWLDTYFDISKELGKGKDEAKEDLKRAVACYLDAGVLVLLHAGCRLETLHVQAMTVLHARKFELGQESIAKYWK